MLRLIEAGPKEASNTVNEEPISNSIAEAEDTDRGGLEVYADEQRGEDSRTNLHSEKLLDLLFAREGCSPDTRSQQTS